MLKALEGLTSTLMLVEIRNDNYVRMSYIQIVVPSINKTKNP